MKAIKNLFHFAGWAACVMLFSQAVPTFGVTATVLVGSGGLKVFTPATTNIPVNSKVIWSWASNEHSTTSGASTGGVGTPDGLWNSGVNSTGHTFTNTFTTPGTFPYYCSVHVSLGMVGSVVVTGSSTAPTVTITNPASGVVLSAPASLTLKANVTDSGSSVTNVQFFQGTTSLGSLAVAPFSVSVKNLSAADYTFSAVAFANDGLTATNTITVSVVAPGPIVMGTPVLSPPGTFQFNYSANVGLTYLVQVSSNLSSWNSLTTNVAAANPAVFTATNEVGSDTFYRVELMPNP